MKLIWTKFIDKNYLKQGPKIFEKLTNQVLYWIKIRLFGRIWYEYIKNNYTKINIEFIKIYSIRIYKTEYFWSF